MWEALSHSLASPRDDVLINIDPSTNISALRHENYKLIIGNYKNGVYDQRFRTNGGTRFAGDLEILTNASTAYRVLRRFVPEKLAYPSDWRQAATLQCWKYETAEDHFLGESPYLFDVEDDPCEQINLAKKDTEVRYVR